MASSFEEPLAEERHRDMIIARIRRVVTLASCTWVAMVAGTVLIGYALGSQRIIHFPTPARTGTMMPWVAISLLMCVIALWLVRSDDISGRRRGAAAVFAAIPVLFGFLFLLEYTGTIKPSIDLLLFPDVLASMRLRFPGRAPVATAISMVLLGLTLLSLDTESARLQKLVELMVLVVALIALERLIGYLFAESTDYAPNWRLMGEAILHPMSPKTATCLLALAIGILFARPERGIVGLYLARGPGGFMARWLLPVAIVLPIALGWLGLIAIRAGLKGNEYPLSLVVTGVILVVLIVVSLSARAIHGVDVERARAAATLAERERILRAVFDNARVGFFMADANGKLVAINQTLEKMLGYTGAELEVLPFTAFINARDAAESYRLLRGLIIGEQSPYRMEKRYIRKDGSQFWGELTTSVALDTTTGRPEFVIGMVRDISKRKEAQETQQRLTAILDATPDFVGISDEQGKAIYVNQAGRKLTGVNGADVTQLSIPDFHPPWAAERVMKEGVPSAIRDGVWTGETALLGADGQHIPVSQVILSHKRNGDVAYLSTMMRDITDRKRLEAGQHFLLEASRAFSGSLETEAILRSLGALLVPAHADYCVICLLTEDNRIELAAVTRYDRQHHELHEQMRVYPTSKKPNPVIEDVVRTANPLLVPVVTDEWLTRLTRGDAHPLLARKVGTRSFMAVPLRGREHVLGVISYTMTQPGRRYDENDLALAQEIAASAALALDNAALLKQSREATRIRDEVLRVVAHDLRNPLNTISLSAGFLRDQWPEIPHDDGAEKLHIIERSVAQADHLIRDLLDVARMEAGKLTVEPKPTPVQELADEAIDLHEPMAAQRNIQLRCEAPEEVVHVHADRPRVLQVLSNLIGNALKFCEHGCLVTLQVARQNGTVRFAVSDNGPGIAASDLEHLFDPFWQASKGGEGAGLGLPIAKAIVQAHGGKIWVASRPGEGSTFYFTLNVDEPQQLEHSKAAD